MDKIKSILSPNKGNDHTVTGEQRGTSGTQGLSGEGSHLGASHTGTSSVVGNNPTGVAGPHDSNLANKADPRVDSDRSQQTGYHGLGNTSNTASGYGSTTTTTAGPHDSNLANKADPRVDSDRSKQTGHSGLGNTSNTSNTTSGYGSTTAGPHDSNLANKADPRVDSDRSKQTGHSGLGNTSNTTSGYGSTTAGPHDSNLGNKADPHVDSDRSKQTGHSGLGNRSSNHHTGRDAATLGAAGVAGEGVHHHRENERDNLGSSSHATGHSGLGNTGSDRHTGRDAATLGAAGVAGEGVHHHRENERDNLGSSSHATGHSGLGNTGSDRHTGRDAATLGAAGVAGEGVHHHRENERDNLGSSSHATGHSGLGNTGSDRHTGRDAATLGAAGAAGEGVHHHRENERDNRDNLGSSSHATSTNPSGLTSYHTGSTGPHSTETANRLDPNVNTQDSTRGGTHRTHEESTDKHHLGRDAAVVGAGAGVAGHEHNKHENNQHEHDKTTGLGSKDNNLHSERYDNTGAGHHIGQESAVGAGAAGLAHEHNKGDLPGPAPNTAGPHKKDWLNKLDPRVNANPDTATTGHGPFKVDAADNQGGANATGLGSSRAQETSKLDSEHSKDHHYGRDAAVAGGVGGTAYEADKHHEHDKDHTNSQRNQEGSHHGRDAAVAGGVGGTAYEADKHHKRDKDPTTSQRNQEGNHHGREAAVAGGVGGTAYEADKHHKHDKDHTTSEKDSKGGLLSFLHRDKNKTYTPEEEAEFSRQERDHNALSTSKPLPSAPGNHGVGTGEGTQNALASEHNTKDHHYGRDAAAVGGAAAVGEHEHNKHSTATHEKPAGSDIGDKLHGVDRNRGVAGASGFPGTEGFGSGPPSHSTGFGNTTGSSGLGNTGTTTSTGHHGSGLTGSGIGGNNEYRKNDTTTGAYGSQEQGVTQGQGAIHGQGLTGSHVGDERNRLHKDHPASHTHGTGIDDNTGVGNSHNVNSGTNY